MLEFIIYMLLPTLLPLLALYFLGIKRFGLGKKLRLITPGVSIIAIVSYAIGEAGVLALKPWFFDCSKAILCFQGLPADNLLVSFIIWFNVAMATLTFMEIEKISKGKKEFLEYFLLLKSPKSSR